LEDKKDHGDIDILVLLHIDQNPKSLIESLNPLQLNKNGHCYSFLYKSNIGKTVQVDFIVSSDPILHNTKKQYYAFNCLSAVIGIMAKSYNFKYSTEGFFKRYKDKKGNWHDILISKNLNPGLQCLGLDPKPLWIKTCDDIVNYVSSSLMFDSSIYKFALDSEDRYKDIFINLMDMKKISVIKDEDYFFKRCFPDQYNEVNGKKVEIDRKVYAISKYNGTWLREKFGIKPGPEMGRILKLISDSFGDLLSEVEEDFVEAFVAERLQ